MTINTSYVFFVENFLILIYVSTFAHPLKGFIDL